MVQGSFYLLRRKCGKPNCRCANGQLHATYVLTRSEQGKDRLYTVPKEQRAQVRSLKLHLENSFLAFERVVRCGGLLGALPPEVASKHLNPQTQEMRLECQGFNDKNHYERATPCDQDTLRKFTRDVPAQRWMDWFNGPVQREFQADGFFDPAGIFVGDGSYLFVPDNPAYEGSVVMWFDEHNHPVEYDKLTAEQRKKAHRERCYKLVSLLHLRGDSYVYAALAVVPRSEE